MSRRIGKSRAHRAYGIGVVCAALAASAATGRAGDIGYAVRAAVAVASYGDAADDVRVALRVATETTSSGLDRAVHGAVAVLAVASVIASPSLGLALALVVVAFGLGLLALVILWPAGRTALRSAGSVPDVTVTALSIPRAHVARAT
ncbi:MAG: hypothetical protein AB7S26_06115 [Sandaracinaceae bacterium]